MAATKTLTASYVLNADGVTKGVSDAESQFGVLEGASDDLGKKVDANTSKLGNGFTKLGNTLGNFGIPFSNSLNDVGTKLNDFKSKGTGAWAAIASVGKVASIATIAGLIAVGGAAADMGVNFQRSETQLAGSADISVKAAQSIGNAFLHTGNNIIYTGGQLMSAYQGVAGQLGAMQGHALDASQAMTVMTAASAGAEATGESLSSVTKDLANTMQAFQVPVKDAKSTMDQLYATSRATGVGIDSLSSTMDRLKARLGVAAPTVGDMGTMLVDLAQHGVSGSKGLLVVNTAVTTLLKSVDTMDTANKKAAATYETKMASAQAAVTKASEALAVAQGKAGTSAELASEKATLGAQKSAAAQQAATDAITKAQTHLDQLRQEYAGKAKLTTTEQIDLQNAQAAITAAQGRAAQVAAQQQASGAVAATTAIGTQGTATDAVTAAQQKLADAQAKLQAVQATGSQSTNANVQAMQQLGLTVYDTQGKFVGMGSVIAQLEPKLKDLTQQQQLQALASVFGTSANKALLATVLAGPQAWDKAQRAVMAHNAAELAAAKQNQSLAREFDLVKKQVTNLGTAFGLALLPMLAKAGRAVADLIQWFQTHKAVAEALAITIGTVLAGAMTVFAVQSVGRAVTAISNLGSNLLHLGSVFQGTAASTDASTASSDTAQKSYSSLSTSIDGLNQTLSTLDGSISQLVAVQQSQVTSAGEVEAANTTMADSFAAVEDAQGTVAAGFAELGGAEQAFTATSGAAAADLATLGAGFEEVGGNATAAAGEFGTYDAAVATAGDSSLTAAGQMDTLGASAEGAGTKMSAAGAAAGEEGMAGDMAGAEGAAGGLSGALGPLGITVGVVTLGAMALSKAITGNQGIGPSFVDASNKAAAMASGTLPDLTLKMAALQDAQDKAAASLRDGGLAGDAARTAYAQLGAQMDTVRNQHTQLTSNEQILAAQFGITKNQALAVASALGVNLTQALDPAQVSAFGQQLQQMGINATGTATAITGMSANAVAALTTLASKLQSTGTSADWGQLGQMIDFGVGNGITQNAGVVVNAAQGMVQSVIAGARTGLKAASPSRVAQDMIGATIPQGVALGILGGIPLVTAATTSMTNGAITAANAAARAAAEKAQSVARAAAAAAQTPAGAEAQYEAWATTGYNPSTGTNAAGQAITLTDTSAPSAVPAPVTISVPVTVQGDVWTTQQLGDAIWNHLLQKGIVNGSPGQLQSV
jgi:hypothetical protein